MYGEVLHKQLKLTIYFLCMKLYVELLLASNRATRPGRQELNYNARFLDNLDWALQARVHDFVLEKFEKAEAKQRFKV